MKTFSNRMLSNQGNGGQQPLGFANNLSTHLNSNSVRPKLKIGAVNDPAEIEADRVADQVMRMPASNIDAGPAANILRPDFGHSGGASDVSVRRKCAACDGEDKIRRKPASDSPVGNILRPPTIRMKSRGNDTGGVAAGPQAQKAIDGLGSGSPLPASERAFFEPRFGRDLSGIRIHTGNQADTASRAINARAFSLGNDIAFASGQYQPGTHSGRTLMAHEITHAFQGGPSGLIQRAEIDDDPQFCQNIQDVTSRLDAHVNSVLSSVQSRHSGQSDGLRRVQAVYEQLGRGSPFCQIEEWAENLPRTHQNRLPISSTRFQDHSNPFLLISGAPFGRRTGSGTINAWIKGQRAIGTLLKIGDPCIGS